MNDKVILAERSNKVVYKEGNQVIKAFDKSFPKEDVLNEALNQARVEATGLPIPKILGVDTTEEGCWSIRTEAIDGKTMEQIMAENPEKLDSLMDEFVELQLMVHGKTSPLLNKLKDKLDGRIVSMGKEQGIDPSVKYELRTRLAGMPKHAKVLHGDFNPSNIIIDQDGKAFILDWAHATQGNASADAATTYLWFSLQKPELADLYLKKFCEKSDTAKQYVQKWLPIVAAARLLKAVPEEKELLMHWLDVVDYE